MRALRHISARECVVCHGPMEGTRRRRYCSDACSLRAYRQRKLLASPLLKRGDNPVAPASMPPCIIIVVAE